MTHSAQASAAIGRAYIYDIYMYEYGAMGPDSDIDLISITYNLRKMCAVRHRPTTHIVKHTQHTVTDTLSPDTALMRHLVPHHNPYRRVRTFVACVCV